MHVGGQVWAVTTSRREAQLWGRHAEDRPCGQASEPSCQLEPNMRISSTRWRLCRYRRTMRPVARVSQRKREREPQSHSPLIAHVRVRLLIMSSCTFSEVGVPPRFFEVRAVTCRETMTAKSTNNRGGTPSKDRVNAVTYARRQKSFAPARVR